MHEYNIGLAYLSVIIENQRLKMLKEYIFAGTFLTEECARFDGHKDGISKLIGSENC